ncbi:hypothetical protein Tco_0688879 [Tanacetum coccineum]
MNLRMTMRIPRRTILTILLMERIGLVDMSPSDDDDDDDDDTDDEDEEPTKDEDREEHIALADSSAVPVVDPVPSVEDTEAFESDESAPTPRSPQTRVPFSHTRSLYARRLSDLSTYVSIHEARIGDFVLTAPPPGCDVAESSTAPARAPRGQYDFVDTVEVGQGLIRSPGHDARTIARAADRAEDVGYVRALQASEHRMMTSIDVSQLEGQITGSETAYERTELHEVRQAYLSFEARNRALLARLETLETHMSHMEWQRQSAEDRGVRQMMRT